MMPKDWDYKPLGEIISYKKGFAFKSENFRDSGRRLIRISDTTSTSIKNDAPVYVEEHESLEKYELLPNDIILSTVGSKPPMYDSMVGKAIKIPHYIDRAYLNQNLVKLVPGEAIDANFLFLKLKEPSFISYISILVRGNANQVSITLDELFNYQVLLPPKPEQEKIAQILSTWNNAIENLNFEISKHLTMFEGLLVTLISGKKRFLRLSNKLIDLPNIGKVPTEWKLTPFDHFVNPVVRNIKKPRGNYTGLGIRSHGKGTFLKYNCESEKIALEELFVVRANDLLVSITFAWEGAIAIASEQDDGALTSHRFPAYVIDSSKINLNFLRYYIRNKNFVKRLGLISPGGAGRNRVLKKADFLKLEIPLPKLDEQKLIGDTLYSLESYINILVRKKDLIIKQKQGLMQQLLTGKKRAKL